MKLKIDLGTVDVEMQRSDGTWEKVDHCRTRIQLKGDSLLVETRMKLGDADRIVELRELLKGAGATVINPKYEIPSYVVGGEN